MRDAFKHLGNTVAITAASSAPTGVQAGASSTSRAAFAGQYRVINTGSGGCYNQYGVLLLEDGGALLQEDGSEIIL